METVGWVLVVWTVAFNNRDGSIYVPSALTVVPQTFVTAEACRRATSDLIKHAKHVNGVCVKL